MFGFLERSHKDNRYFYHHSRGPLTKVTDLNESTRGTRRTWAARRRPPPPGQKPTRETLFPFPVSVGQRKNGVVGLC